MPCYITLCHDNDTDLLPVNDHQHFAVVITSSGVVSEPVRTDSWWVTQHILS